MRCFIHGAVGNQNKIVGLKRRLVPQDAILGNAQAKQTCPNGAQATHHDGAFQRPMIQLTNAPATSSGPKPGIQRNAEPNKSPDSPPQKAPVFPHTFIRSPAL